MVDRKINEPIVGNFQSDERIFAREDTVDSILEIILANVPEGSRTAKMVSADGATKMSFFRDINSENAYWEILGGFSEGKVGGYIFVAGYDPTRRIGTISEGDEAVVIMRENEAKALKEKMEALAPVAIIK